MHNILKDKVIWLLVLLVLIGGLFRFYEISKQSYWIDEAITIINVESIQKTGVPRLASGNYYSCPLYCYPTAFLANTFGNTPAVFRFQAVLFGILFIFIIFLVAKKIYDKKVALLSSFIVTFSYWQITWSRQTRWYTLFECFFWLSVLCFIYAREAKNKTLPLVITTLLTALTMLSHQLGYLLPIIFGAILVYDRWKGGKINLKFIATVVGSISLLFLASETVLHLSLLKSLGRHIELTFVLPYYLFFYLRTYWFLIIFTLLAVFLRKDKSFTQHRFLCFILLSYFLFLSFFSRNINYGHLFQVTPVLIILGAAGMLSVIEKIKRPYIKIVFIILTGILFFTVGGGVFKPMSHYYLENDNPASRLTMSTYYITAQPDWNGAYKYIAAHKKPRDIIISTVPQFNKIFLNEPGYWLSYLSNPSDYEKDGKDMYVGASVIHNSTELQTVTSGNHGYIVFEGIYGKSLIDGDLLSYITTLSQKYYVTIGDHSVLVYSF